MKNAKISRRSFLLGLAACSVAGVLTACKGTDAPSGSTASSAAEPARILCSVLGCAAAGAVPDRSGVSPAGRQHRLHPADGADAGRYHRHGLGGSPQQHHREHHRLRMGELWSVRHHHPDAGGVRSTGLCKGRAAGSQCGAGAEAIGVDALVFIVNEDNPVQALTQQQLRDIYAGKITNWKDVAARIRKSLPSSAARTPAVRPCSKSCSFRVAS